MADYTPEQLKRKANELRLHVIEMTTAAGSGHPGGSLSAADLIAALYFRVMRHDPKNPQWEDRDRFVLSKGHVAPVLYAALAEAGYFPVEDLVTLRKMGSKLQGHPVRGKVPGVEMSTGSHGQGLSMAAGIALAGKIDSKDYYTYCLTGDGELQSGQNWEAAMFAAHYKLSKLIAFVDRNHLQIEGDTEKVLGLNDVADKFLSFGWNVYEVDGHDIDRLLGAIALAKENTDGPSVIIMETVKGKGVSFMENNAGFHGRACKPEEYEQAVKELREVLQ